MYIQYIQAVAPAQISCQLNYTSINKMSSSLQKILYQVVSNLKNKSNFTFLCVSYSSNHGLESLPQNSVGTAQQCITWSRDLLFKSTLIQIVVYLHNVIRSVKSIHTDKLTSKFNFSCLVSFFYKLLQSEGFVKEEDALPLSHTPGGGLRGINLNITHFISCHICLAERCHKNSHCGCFALKWYDRQPAGSPSQPRSQGLVSPRPQAREKALGMMLSPCLPSMSHSSGFL